MLKRSGSAVARTRGWAVTCVAGDGVEGRVALYGVEAAAVEREEVALFRARREKVPHPALQTPDRTTQVKGHCKSRTAVTAG